VAKIICGSSIEVLKTIDENSFQTCVTSPPYYSLRDYGVDGQLGLEDTPNEYISSLVDIFREVKRTLRKDGTLWVVIGDCYNGSGGAGGDYNEGGLREGQPRYPGRNIDKLKSKDLIGIPWMLAFAMREDGWYLRADVIWAKPNPMPESVMDRPTRCHETVFLFAKSQKYYYDNEAIKEPISDAMQAAIDRGVRADKQFKHDEHNRFGKRSGNRAFSDPDSLARIASGRNKRDVWFIPTKPSGVLHYAAFPPNLIEPCVLAGSSDKACNQCCAPWVKEYIIKEKGTATDTTEYSKKLGGKSAATRTRGNITADTREFVGYKPTCDCKRSLDTGKSIVLDPFCGTGVTGEVAIKNKRDFIGIDISEKYCKIAREKIGEVQEVLF